MVIVFGMRWQRYNNMPLLMTRWLANYSTHQSNLSKLTLEMYHMAKEIWQKEARVRKGMWILALAPTN